MLKAFDGGADSDAAGCEDVGSEAAAMDQFAQHALMGEPLQMGAGLTEPAPDAFDVAAETRAFLTDNGVDLTADQETKTKKALEYFAAASST